MLDQKEIDYKRIETAIHFIRNQFKNQPSLEEIAEIVHLSPYHFQRMFCDWSGVSPKKFMQYLSLNYAKDLLKDRASIMEAAHEVGLSGTSRLHDLFLTIEGMTPGEFKNGGASLNIHYSFANSPFGKVIVASTPKGICHMHFEEDEKHAVSFLQKCFPCASFSAETDSHQQNALRFFQQDWTNQDQLKLHLAGTPFQLKVWESLLKIPMGSLTTYGDVAQNIGNAQASRAVGTAIGRNPVAFLIPCHRVIQRSGEIGGYMWGANKKAALIGWEAAQKGKD